MILTVEELRKYITTDLPDDVLSFKLSAIETAIRKYTNNNFQNRSIRCISDIKDGQIMFPSEHFKVGDTVQISQDSINEGLYVLGESMTLEPVPVDSDRELITKVSYPADVKMGVINLMQWDIEKRDKIGVSSETISRHSVTYFNMDGSNSLVGFPSVMMGFLKPYMKARF